MVYFAAPKPFYGDRRKKRLLSGNRDGGFEPVARMGRIANNQICKQPHEKTGRSKTVPFPVADGNGVLKLFKPRYIKAKTVAKLLGISPSSGYELMHEKGFPVLKIGSRLVVPKEKFRAWVEQNTGGNE